MDLDIVEATTVMADLEKGGLVQIQSSGELVIKELGGISWNGLQQINIKRLSAIIRFQRFSLRMNGGHETESQGGLCGS